MIPDPSESLALALRERHLTEDVVLRHVEHVYGSVEAVFATGSLVAGFGNKGSDLDLCVIVDRDRIGDMPIVSFERESVIDVEYHAAADLERRTDSIQAAWPASGPVTFAAWLDRHRAITKLSRFATGHALTATDRWRTWQRNLAERWLSQALTQWFVAEAARFLQVAQWLWPDNPWLAADRYCQAVVLAAEARAAQQGELYAGGSGKWVLGKIRRAGLTTDVPRVRDCLRLPTHASEFDSYRNRQIETLLHLLPLKEQSGSWSIELWRHPDATVRGVGKSTLWTKDGIEAIELGLPIHRDGEEFPIAVVPFGKDLSIIQQTLFEKDWLWPSLVETTISP